MFFGTLSRESVLGSSIRQSRILAEGLPPAGNGKFPHISTKIIIAILLSVFFDTLSREFVPGSSIRQSRILAEGLPLAGNGKFPHTSTKTIIAILLSVFFSTLSRESVPGSSIRQSRILAEGLPLAGNTQPLSLVECFFLCEAVALFTCGRIKARSYAFFFLIRAK